MTRTPMVSLERKIGIAAGWIRQADGLLIAAGAGMGVDSGLPDFRGRDGFWNAYPTFARSGLDFQEVASAQNFRADPVLAWGFYGHRLRLYRDTQPHRGFAILRTIAERLTHGAFIFTSNVDGQFQKAGFREDQVCECHGSIHHLQCVEPCAERIWPASSVVPVVDVEHCRLVSTLPSCPSCGGLARPNILMFDDWQWIADRTDRQRTRLDAWLTQVQSPLIIELGAGKAIATVRHFSDASGLPMIRINPREAGVAGGKSIGLRAGALEALELLGNALGC